MALNKVNLYRIDGNLGSVSNIQTSALNNRALAGTRESAPLPAPLTPEQKLATTGLTVTELRQLLGLKYQLFVNIPS